MDIRKEDISKMRLRVGICNNEIINAQTELVISHIKKVHKDVSFTKFDIGGGRHFNTSGIAGVPENVLCNMNDVVPWSVAVSDAISAGYIDVGVTGLNELFANDMSEILKQGVTFDRHYMLCQSFRIRLHLYPCQQFHLPQLLLNNCTYRHL